MVVNELRCSRGKARRRPPWTALTRCRSWQGGMRALRGKMPLKLSITQYEVANKGRNMIAEPNQPLTRLRHLTNSSKRRQRAIVSPRRRAGEGFFHCMKLRTSVNLRIRVETEAAPQRCSPCSCSSLGALLCSSFVARPARASSRSLGERFTSSWCSGARGAAAA